MASLKSVLVVSCVCFLPSLFLFCLEGGLPYFFLKLELFHRAGSCSCITEAKEALKDACPRLELCENWLDVWCLLVVAPFLSPVPQLLPANRSQKDPKLESLVLRRNHLPSVLGLIKISHYLLTSVLYAKPFPSKKSSGQPSPEVLPVQS